MSLYRCVYVSRTRLEPGEAEAFDRLVRASAARNAARGISGLLVAMSGAYLQVLEGEPDALVTLLGKIIADPRHDAVTVLDMRPAADRLYPDWGLGAARPGGADPLGYSYAQLVEMSAKQLYAVLASFSRAGAKAVGGPVFDGDYVYL